MKLLRLSFSVGLLMASLTTCKDNNSSSEAKSDNSSATEPLFSIGGYGSTSEVTVPDSGIIRLKFPNGGKFTISNQAPCFVAGTMITTPHGAVPIESLKLGDKVISYDETTGGLTESAVTATFVHEDQDVTTLNLGNGEQIVATPNHPFYLADKHLYTNAGSLKKGDLLFKLQDHNSPLLMVTLKAAPRSESQKARVFNFTATPHRNYFAGSVLVHNY